jgi:RND family efflux transporter MFP subunit
LFDYLIDYLSICVNTDLCALREVTPGSLPDRRRATDQKTEVMSRVIGWPSVAVVLVLGSIAVPAPARAADPSPRAVPAEPVPALASVTLQPAAAEQSRGFDGVVEAIRQTTLAAQVAGSVIALNVKSGDVVSAGQVLLRIDARAADQNAAASVAQVSAAEAALAVAARDFERQQELFQKQYISAAALERATAQFKSTQAQVDAQRAQAGAARTQTGFHVVIAPYAAVVADVPVTLGDMALPGRPLVTLYDPSALRVTAAVPQTALAGLAPQARVRVELPGMAAAQQWPVPLLTSVLPTVDAATHTGQIRLDLPSGLAGVAPGMFARVWLPTPGNAAPTLRVPAAAIVRRAELTAVYVLDPDGRPLLRQVRLGRAAADGVEVLAGLSAGDRVALDPPAAARVR